MDKSLHSSFHLLFCLFFLIFTMFSSSKVKCSLEFKVLECVTILDKNGLKPTVSSFIVINSGTVYCPAEFVLNGFSFLLKRLPGFSRVSEPVLQVCSWTGAGWRSAARCRRRCWWSPCASCPRRRASCCRRGRGGKLRRPYASCAGRTPPSSGSAPASRTHATNRWNYKKQTVFSPLKDRSEMFSVWMLEGFVR